MKLDRLALAAAVVGVALMATVTPAQADTFYLTSCHVSSSTCEGGNVTDANAFGTVTLTQATATTVTIDVVLFNGNRFVETGAGAGELFLFNATSTMGVTDVTATFNGTNVSSTLGGVAYTFNNTTVGANTGFHADGTGNFLGGIGCTVDTNCNGGNIVTTVNDLHFTVTNATLAQLEVTNATGNYFAADIQCGATQPGCSNGLTGPVDASTPPTVPDGGLTAGLLGFALVGLETLRRKRRA